MTNNSYKPAIEISPLSQFFEELPITTDIPELTYEWRLQTMTRNFEVYRLTDSFQQRKTTKAAFNVELSFQDHNLVSRQTQRVPIIRSTLYVSGINIERGFLVGSFRINEDNTLEYSLKIPQIDIIGHKVLEKYLTLSI